MIVVQYLVLKPFRLRPSVANGALSASRPPVPKYVPYLPHTQPTGARLAALPLLFFLNAISSSESLAVVSPIHPCCVYIGTGPIYSYILSSSSLSRIIDPSTYRLMSRCVSFIGRPATQDHLPSIRPLSPPQNLQLKISIKYRRAPAISFRSREYGIRVYSSI